MKLKTAIAANFKVTTLIVSEALAVALAVKDVSRAAGLKEASVVEEVSAAATVSVAAASEAEVSVAEVGGAEKSRFIDSHEPREHPRDATELVRVELHCFHEIARPMLHLVQILDKNPEAGP